jgi:endonuclease/exonuclease/phosphatase family metal-dependent hydrolase
MTHRSTKTLAAALLAPVAALLLLLALASFGSEADARPKAPDRGFTAMAFNIHHGVGVDGRLDLDRTAGVIRAADAEVVGLQEVDNGWFERSAFQDQARELADRLGMHYVYAANLDREPLEPGGKRRQYGTAILSEYPILESENTLLPRPEGGEQRGLLEALINVRGVPVRVYNTHLQHNSAAERTAQVAAIMSHVGESEEPTLLVGDLNARPDAPEMQPLYTRFEDAWVEGGEGPGYTYPAEAPDRRIDYVLVSPDVSVREAHVPRTLASDHLPVVAEVEVPGEAVGIGRSGR